MNKFLHKTNKITIRIHHIVPFRYHVSIIWQIEQWGLKNIRVRCTMYDVRYTINDIRLYYLYIYFQCVIQGLKMKYSELQL